MGEKRELGQVRSSGWLPGLILSAVFLVLGLAFGAALLWLGVPVRSLIPLSVIPPLIASLMLFINRRILPSGDLDKVGPAVLIPYLLLVSSWAGCIGGYFGLAEVLG
ncbi:MAG: hypothetical protein LCH41_08475 [Armatimonadetes bacterium]|nr:hypothetical protein [Armatimonadota bacterium]